MEISIISQKIVKLYRIFRENCAKNIGICIYMGSVAELPEATDFLKKLVEKSMETFNFLKVVLNYERIFIEEANSNKNRGKVDGLLKSLTILREIKKPSCKSLRVWS